MSMVRRHLLAMAAVVFNWRAHATSPSAIQAVPLNAPTPMARLRAGPGGTLMGLAANGELWRASSAGWQMLGAGLDPDVPLAVGHGRVAGRSASGRLWVLEAGQVSQMRAPALAPHAGLLVLDRAIIALISGEDGQQRVVRLERDRSGWVESARSHAVVLPDARPLQFDPDSATSDDNGHVVVFGAPSGTRYRHGVLGDAVEATSLMLLERHSLQTIAQLELQAPHVFEDIAPRPVAWQGKRGLLTIRSGPLGAQLVVVARSGSAQNRFELAALGEPLGTPNRWMSPSTDGHRLWAVHTPHLGGVLHVYEPDGKRLNGRLIARDMTNHEIGQRELDVSAWIGRHWVVPSQDRQHLLLINTDEATRPAAPVSVALSDAVISLQPWRRGPETGVVALLRNGSAWWVPVAS